MIETSLRSESQRRLAEIAPVDILIGIPTYKNARTVAAVARTAAEGLARYFPQWRGALAIVDGGSSDDTLAQASAARLPHGIRRVVTLYQGIPGKGSAVRAIFEMARVAHAQLVIVLEADLQTLTPEWIQKLAQPILAKEYSFVVPCYHRPIPDGAVTDLIAYPLTRLLYGADVRQPMGGEFAVSAEVAARLCAKDVWETDIARHGVDIWLTTVALNEGIKLCQVRLGTKLDDSRELLLTFEPTFVQAVGTLFRLIDIYRRRWHEAGAPRSAPVYGDGVTSETAPRAVSPLSTAAMADAFAAGARRYARVWRSALSPHLRAAVRILADKPGGAYHFPANLWARVVFDFAVVYNKGEGDPDKVVAALLPLYHARVATIMKETAAKPDAVEKAIQAQADTFIAEKAYLLRRWASYVPWAWEGVR